MTRARRNPNVGRHPDLFEEGALTPVFVPLDEVPHDQLVALSYFAFRGDEFDQLDKATRLAVMKNAATRAALDDLDPAGVTLEKWDSYPYGIHEYLVTKAWKLDEVRANEELWEGMGDTWKGELVEHDPDAEERIEQVAGAFEERWKEATDPNEEYVESMLKDSDDFEQWAGENADSLVDMADQHGFDVDGLVSEYEEDGYSEDQVKAAIDEALRDRDNYDISYNTDEYGSAFFKDSTSIGYFQIDYTNVAKDGQRLDKIIKEMSDLELEIAVERINEATNKQVAHYGRRREGLTADDLRKQFNFEIDLENQVYADYDPDWDKVSEAVASILEDIEPENEGAEGEQKEETGKSIEERIVHRWKDGFYVVELLPKEYVAEGAPYVCAEHGPFYPKDGDIYGSGKTAPCPKCGKQCPRNEGSLFMCIGSPSQRFCKVARKGQGRGWSLRTSSGKRKIAIFADLKPDGSIRRIDQAKGYRNRLPGFAGAETGGSERTGKFKPDEVVKVAEFVASLGVDPYHVQDLRPGMLQTARESEEHPENREFKRALDSMNAISPEFIQKVEGEAAVRRIQAPRENPSRPCRHCGGEAGGFCG